MIDAHHHLWIYRPEEYGWISQEMEILRRDFLPEDLRKTAGEVGIRGAVTVQARQTLEETSWLLGLAEDDDFLRGVVGWVPLTDPSVEAHLERFAGHRKLKGVRHVLQDEADDGYVLRDDFNRGVSLLAGLGLRYDILIYERHLPQTIQFIDRHPRQVFIVDHIGKPRIAEHQTSPWRQYMVELARRDHVFCKLSGMVTEANWRGWTARDLEPYFETVLSAFGPRRVMFGSDWPVLLPASSYKRWFQTVREAIARLPASEQEWIMERSAIRAYDL